MTEIQLLVQSVLCVFIGWTLGTVLKLKKQINEQKKQIDDLKRELEELKRKE